ncbi:MAG: toxin-activating lysine-acyltransferase [Phascolarctobacterium faecium]
MNIIALAYILGNITWLMMHSKQHETMPLHMMASQIFPAIANKQYVLECQKKPVVLYGWANFDDAAEASI